MGEQQNILSGLVQTGTVTAIDSAKRKARVKFKDTGIISGWLYVLQHYGADFYIEPDAKHTHEITDTFTGGEVSFRQGPITKCARLGGFGILDEINMAKNDSLHVLIPGIGEVVRWGE